MRTDALHVHTETQPRCVTKYSQEEEIKNTHIPADKGPIVCGEKMNCLCCVIRMTHQTVINENRIKVLIKGEKCRHKSVSKQKTRSLAVIPEQYLAFS